MTQLMKKLFAITFLIFGTSVSAKTVPAIKTPVSKIKRVVKTIPHAKIKTPKVFIKRVTKNVDSNSFENRDTSMNIQLTYMIDLSK